LQATSMRTIIKEKNLIRFIAQSSCFEFENGKQPRLQ
jgi:hypothetical protein